MSQGRVLNDWYIWGWRVGLPVTIPLHSRLGTRPRRLQP